MVFWGKWVGSSHVVGLDVGSHTLKACQLKPKKGSFQLFNMGTLSLPHGTIVDGEVLDAFTLEESIKELLGNLKIKTKNVALAVSGSSVITKHITIPRMTIEELDNQLSIIAAQYISFSPEEMMVDYQILPLENDAAQKMDLMLYAANKKFLEHYESVIIGADLNPVTIETGASALVNLFDVCRSHLIQAPNQKSLLLHIGACLTQFIMLHDTTPIYQCDIPVGGNQITEDLREKLKLSFAEAEALKISSHKEKHLPRETEAIIDQSCESVAASIHQSLNQYVGNHPDTHIDHIFLSGGTSSLEPLKKWISEKIGTQTTYLAPFDTIQIDGKKWGEETIRSMEPLIPVALGLATRSTQEI